MRIDRDMLNSLRFKIVLAYFIIIALGFLLINSVVTHVVERDFLSVKKIDFQRYAIEIAETIAEDFSNNDDRVIFTIMNMGEEMVEKENQSTRVLVLNSSGVVNWDSYNDYSSQNRFVAKNLANTHVDIRRVLNGEYVPAADTEIEKNGERKRVLYSYAPIIWGGSETIGMVVVSTSLKELDETLKSISTTTGLFSSIILIVILIMGFIMSNYITNPLNRLTSAIRGMSMGNLGQKINIRGYGELKQLGDSFNTMSEKIANLDRARNEFVSNASHELKTPMTAMKVLADSLLTMNIDDIEIYKEFMTDITNEIDRLNFVITDLLNLVKLDADTDILRLRWEMVDLVVLLRRCIRILKPLADRKSINIEFDLSHAVSVNGDKLKLTQVFYNMLDNAIKYTPVGGNVVVTLSREETGAGIMVTDSGIGIPEKDLPYIFDRFYRVDKARSRETGGTGLGLSICHRIIIQHGGDIEVDSKEDEGSTFTVALPYNLDKTNE